MSDANAGQISLLQRWLAVLAAIAGVAVLQALLLPRWPRAQDLSASSISSALGKAGLQATALASLPAERSYERSLSSVLAWRFAGGDELRVVHGSVRQRKTFQAAFLARDQRALTLVSRRLDVPIPGSAAGLIQGRPAYQSCMVPQLAAAPAMAITAEDLGEASDRRVSRQIDTLKGLIGLQPTRSFDCVLVSLRSPSRQLPAVAIWQEVLQVVSESLRASSQR